MLKAAGRGEYSPVTLRHHIESSNYSEEDKKAALILLEDAEKRLNYFDNVDKE